MTTVALSCRFVRNLAIGSMLLAPLCLAQPAAAQTPPAVQWRVEDGGNGHWYQLVIDNPSRTWTEARAHSQSVGGELCVLTDRGEFDFVVAMARATPEAWYGPSSWDVKLGPWVGATQVTSDPEYTEPDGGWMWIDGTAISSSDPHVWFNNATGCGTDENRLHLWEGFPTPGNVVLEDIPERGFCDIGSVISHLIEWSADCNNDGIVDYGQILSGALADANANGVPDSCEFTDTDGDGADDTVDGCPLDGTKQEPGACGCGTPDTDTDHDGTADCLEVPFGSVGGWGYNRYGPLDVPVGLPAVKQISSGYQHTIALLMDGSVAAWGFNDRGQCDVPTGLSGVVSIAGGREHSLALNQDGSVVAWGSQAHGQSTVPAGLTDVARIAAGGDHSLALRHNGSIVAWGRNDRGQCDVPFEPAPFLAVAGGYSHTMAIRSDGTVVCWGDSFNGQCTVPAGLSGVVAVAAGVSHSIALTAAGTVVCWGSNNTITDVPADLTDVAQIAAGTGHSVALKSDGTVVCWGYNFENQCTVPADLQICRQVAAGNSHTIVLQVDCNHDEVADYLQIGGNDCNQDSILDACQFDSGPLEDCNANGIGDQCEKQVDVVAVSPRIAPIGFGAPATWSVPSAVQAVEHVDLFVRAKGDFGGSLEWIDVTVGDSGAAGTIFRIFGPGGPDCQVTGAPISLTPQAFNNAIRSDGTLQVRAVASIAVDAGHCFGDTWIEFELRYTGAAAPDCNANGLLDSCELAAGYAVDANGNGVIDDCEAPITQCPGDYDFDQAITGQDLSLLLAAWGTANQQVDLTGDGQVDGNDMAVLLAGWGTCAD